MSSKRTITYILLSIALFSAVWLTALFSLPYGNHLGAVYFPEDEPENIFEQFFFSRSARILSGIYTDYAPVKCSSNIVFWQEGDGLQHERIDVANWILAYSDYKARRENGKRDRSLILRMIKSCPSNGSGNIPPLSAAVMIGDIEFVDALLKTKTDPYFGYLSQRGNHICPIVVATTMRDLSVKKASLRT